MTKKEAVKIYEQICTTVFKKNASVQEVIDLLKQTNPDSIWLPDTDQIKICDYLSGCKPIHQWLVHLELFGPLKDLDSRHFGTLNNVVFYKVSVQTFFGKGTYMERFFIVSEHATKRGKIELENFYDNSKDNID